MIRISVFLIIILLPTFLLSTILVKAAVILEGNSTDPLINEFVFDHIGIDTHEFVEVAGDGDTDYSAFSLLQIEGDSSSSAEGVIDSVFPITTTNAAGYWTTGFLNNELENGTVSLLLVEAFTGTTGLDLDTNDDGILDITPWLRIVDAVAVTDGSSSDFTYANVTLPPGFDGTAGRVWGASRLPDKQDTDIPADWTRNDPDGAGLPGFIGTPDSNEALNTPGATNLPAVATPQLLVINEVDYDQPGADAAEFVEIRNNDTMSVNLYPYRLEFINGEGALVYQTIQLPNLVLPPDDYFVVCSDATLVIDCDLTFSDAIQDGAPDAVALWLDTTLIDTVSYEGDTAPPFTEGSGVGLEDDGLGLTGISRYPDGLDTNQNNSDFSLRCITPGQANTAASDNCEGLLPPTIAITLTAVLLSLPEPGGPVTFTVQVANQSTTSVTLTALAENVLNDLNGQGDCTLPQTMAIDTVYTCSYAADISGSAGQTVTRTVTADAQNQVPLTTQASDSITLTITEPTSSGPQFLFLPVVLRPRILGEPNNSCGEAFPLGLNQPAQFLAEDENDWYRFSLSQMTQVQVELSNFIPQAGQVTVWYGVPCTAAVRVGHDGTIAVNRVLDLGMQPAGDYFIWLINAGALNTADLYTIEVLTP